MASCFLPRLLAWAKCFRVLGRNLICALELNCFLWVTVEVEINSYATSREKWVRNSPAAQNGSNEVRQHQLMQEGGGQEKEREDEKGMWAAREGKDQELIWQPNWFYWFQRWSNLRNKIWVFTRSSSPKEVSFRYQQPESFIHIIRHVMSSTCKSNLLYFV